MLRRTLLPLLALGLLVTTEAAQAQTAPAAPASRQAYRKAAKAERVLSKREQQAADAQARLQAAQVARNAAAAQAPAGNTSWSGWSDEPLPVQAATAPHRATGYNVSSAPGMPLNQLGHGVSTDYNGRPLPAAPAVATTARR